MKLYACLVWMTLHDDGVSCNLTTDLVRWVVKAYAYGVSCLISTQLEQHCLAIFCLNTNIDVSQVP